MAVALQLKMRGLETKSTTRPSGRGPDSYLLERLVVSIRVPLAEVYWRNFGLFSSLEFCRRQYILITIAGFLLVSASTAGGLVL